MSGEATVADIAQALATGLILSGFGLAFLAVTAGAAWVWTRFRQSHINSTPGIAAASKCFFTTWAVLVVAGAAGLAIWAFNAATDLVEAWHSIDGCINC